MIILDADAIVKLVIKEEGSGKAIREVNKAIENGNIIAVPDIALAESLNAIWKHFNLLKDISKKELDMAVEQLLFVWDKITKFDTKKLAQSAIDLAITYNITTYDSLYIAAAKANNSSLLTFDGGIIKKASLIGIKLL